MNKFRVTFEYALSEQFRIEEIVVVVEAENAVHAIDVAKQEQPYRYEDIKSVRSRETFV